MKKKEVSVLIVGQGIAGSVLHHELSKRGIHADVLDNGNLSNSSRVAAGIINPLTGRKFNLSWNYDIFKPHFLETYHEIGIKIGSKILNEKEIVRVVEKVADENYLLSKLSQNPYSEYATPIFPKELSPFFNEALNYISVKGFQLDTTAFLNGYRALLNNAKSLIKADLKISLKQNIFKDYDKVIFCDGANVVSNPFFNWLPFQPAKGEVLIVKIPNLKLSYIYKHQLFISRIEDSIYWVGSGYEWDFDHGNPTEDGKEKLLKKFNQVIKVPYEIIDHIASIRPSTKYRRPILGQHNEHKNIYLLNGLGTKGSMLAPYLAYLMTKHIINGEEIPEEININRY